MSNNKKKLIVRIAEGIGNQMFMYANAYNLSQQHNYDLLIDDTSGYFKKKNQVRKFELNKFNITGEIATNKHKFDNTIKDIKRKFLKGVDFLNKRKNFCLETIGPNKKTFFKEINIVNFSDIFFIEGHFESENYFFNQRSNLIKLFQVKDEFISKNNNYIKLLSESNSVSICIRQNRFSERINKNFEKSNIFTKETINYVNQSVSFIKKKIDNPKFFLWSNDFSNLSEYFSQKDFIFINNNINKSFNDFNLFKYCKHFIVGPTSFHWWGAWLNNNPNKICVRPSNINPSNNKNFWPESWIKI